MTRLPAALVVGPHTVAVLIAPPPRDMGGEAAEGAFGRATNGQLAIWIHPDLPPPLALGTLFHELLHAICFVHGIEEPDHRLHHLLALTIEHNARNQQ